MEGTKMKRQVLWLTLFPIIPLLGCSLFRPSGSKPVGTASGDLLKRPCLEAAVRGIKTEIFRYQGWIDLRKQNPSDPQDLPGLEEGMKTLKSDLERYQAMDPKDYRLPGGTKVKAWVEGRAGENSILHIEGMSRSGPWYHLAGIKGDDYGVLVPDKKYLVTFYKVYPRNYFHMESAYVYIAEYQELE
jgi:hypothetical protein